MFYIDEYYTITKEMCGRINKKQIYLTTEKPTLFEQIRIEFNIMLNVKNV